MKRIIRVVKHPCCFGKMYARGEEYMADHCMGCPAFSECKDIGYGVESVRVSIPAEPSRDVEYLGRW